MADDGWLLSGPTAPDEVRRHYDDWAPEYDATLDGWGYDAPRRAAGLVVAALDAESRSGDVLDAGCGTGLVGAALRELGVAGRITGIDLSEVSLARARERRAGERAVYDRLEPADLQRPLDLPSAQFSAAVCVGVLTYVPDTEAIWRELARVVRPGGVVVCTQRADVWDARRCDTVVDALERDGTWTAVHLSAPADYMPGNAEFGTAIGVRYLAARIRQRRVGASG